MLRAAKLAEGFVACFLTELAGGCPAVWEGLPCGQELLAPKWELLAHGVVDIVERAGHLVAKCNYGGDDANSDQADHQRVLHRSCAGFTITDFIDAKRDPVLRRNRNFQHLGSSG